MANEIDKSIAKRAAVTAKKQSRRRIGKIVGNFTAGFFIAVLVALSVNSIVSLSKNEYTLTAQNSQFNAFLRGTQSGVGLAVMLFLIALIVAVWCLTYYIIHIQAKKQLEISALKKSQEALSRINLRYDNVHEITAVMDVLGMVTDKQKTKAEKADVTARLNAFIKAENIELPQTPETVAILDSLPAPDTPGTLAAALSAGATLRQAEDGQTLVLTTISGGKNILLTPVQTDEGIILCRQGVRIRSDLAPNLENIGISSMPASPEFFEGLPLEKDVVYPELPQPAARTFGPEMLTGGTVTEIGEVAASAELPMPNPAVRADVKELGLPDAAPEHKLLESAAVSDAENGYRISLAEGAYAKYRGVAAASEIKQTEELHALLNDATPLTEEEKRRIQDYRNTRKKPQKNKPQNDSEADEKKAARQAAAARRKKEREDFLNSLSPEEREHYLAEQKLKKSREATIRRLKKIAADRKLLDKIDED